MSTQVSGESALAAPELGARLAALRALCAPLAARPRQGVNLHLHTNHSFSSFRSPTEAVAQAVGEGLAVLGINDHYTVAGHEEFGQACAAAGIPATFSMEAVAMDRDAAAAGELINDPNNPGRAYLCAKGVTKRLPDGSEPARMLAGLRTALEERNRAMAGRLDEVFRQRLGSAGPSWDEVVGLTPAGNVTERHLAKAAWLALEQRGGGGKGTATLCERLCAARPTTLEAAGLQGFIRAKLLKAGGPCYVAESPEAFLSFEDMRRMFLGFGAIPTYPALLDPVTVWEQDVPLLFDRLEERGFLALEVIPARNTRERLAALVSEARRRWWPVFSGTEHNTPEPGPLLDEFSLDPEFEGWFADSAAVLLGHQAERAGGRPGFIADDGWPGMADARHRFGCMRDSGRRVWKK